jgi:SAM-dependent methyltransferase
MADLFGFLASGYARSRPPLHAPILERVREHLGLVRPVDRALDVGCGAGLSTRPLAAIARSSIGIEPSEAMLKLGVTVAPSALFVVGRAEALPVRSHSIDIITAAGSLNYTDLNQFFPEARRVLRHDGVLVVYDFSAGRTLRGPDALDEWFAEFMRRYPAPRDSALEISPEFLASYDSSFRMTGHEYFEIGLTLTPRFYLEYILTETNVAEAVRRGIPEAEIRGWCSETLGAVFGGEAREVFFRGYFACLS